MCDNAGVSYRVRDSRWCLPFLPGSFCACIFTLTIATFADGQEEPAADPITYPQARPEDLGLTIPKGEAKAGAGRRVLVKDLHRRLVVGRVHVEIADRYLVLLPNGRIISVPQREATLTDRPFVAASKQEMIEDMTGGAFHDFDTKTTNRFIYIYNTSEAFATATSRILETMYPTLFRYCKGQGIDVHNPDFPLVVVMFRDRAQFDRYRRIPPGALAYYNIVNNQIVMYEESELTKFAPELALKTSISTIAHEGVHQILFNIGVQQRLSRWPAWISEGLPEYFSPTEVGKRVRWKGLGLVNDARMYRLIQVYKQEGDGGRRWFELEQNIKTPRLQSLGYAKAWATVYTMAKFRRKEFAAFLQEASQLGPLESPPAPGALFSKHFGDDYRANEKMIVTKLKKVKYVDPVENQTYFVGMVETSTHRHVIYALSPTSLKRWRGSIRGGKFQVRAFPSRTAARNYSQQWIRQGQQR